MTSRLDRARVLLIGDSVDEREMYGEALRMEGICTLQATTASTAVRLATELAPSAVVISDGRLDSGLGLSLIRNLRSGAVDGLGPPILLVTSHARPPDIRAAMNAGCDRVIVKPCAPDTLIQVLDELVAVGRPSLENG